MVQNESILLSLSNALTLCPAVTSLTVLPLASVCARGGHYMLGNSCSCTSKRKGQVM